MSEKILLQVEIDAGKSIATIKELKDEIKLQNKELENADKNSETYKRQEKLVAGLKTELKILTDETRNQSKAALDARTHSNAQEGSIKQLSIQVRNAKKEYQEMGAVMRDSEAGQAKLKEVQQLDAEYKELQLSIGNTAVVVGDYERATKAVNMSLGEMKTEMRELRNTSFSGLTQEQIQAVKQRMAELTDAMGKATGQIKAMSNDSIPALVTGLQGVVVAAQGVIGTLTLFGVESEHMEKLQKQMVALIGISQALNTVEKMYKQQVHLSVIATVKKITVGIKDIAVKTTQTAVTWALVAAMGAYIAIIGFAIAGVVGMIKYWEDLAWWGKALVTIMAGPIAPIILLIKYFDDLVLVGKQVLNFLYPFGQLFDTTEKSIGKVTNKTDEYIASMKQQQKIQEALIGDMEFEIRLMNAKGESIDDIKKKERELIIEQLKNAKTRLDIAMAEAYRGRVKVEALKEEAALLKMLYKDLVIFDAEEVTRKKNITLEQNKKTEAVKEEIKAVIELELTQKQIAEQQIARLKDLTEQKLLNLKQQYADELITEQEYLMQVQELKQMQLIQELELLRGNEEMQNEFRAKELEFANMVADEKIEIKKRELKERQEAEKKYYDSVRNQIKSAEETSQRFMMMVSDNADKGMEGFKNFKKQFAVMMLDILQKQLMASSAMAALQSLTQPDSIATFGAAGAIRAAIIIGLINGAFAAVKGKIMSMEDGGIIGGKRHSAGGTIIEAEKGEIIWSRKDVAAVGGVRRANAMRPTMEHGGIVGLDNSSVNTETIMLNAIKNIQIVATVEDINAGLSREFNRMKIGNV